VTSDSDLPRPRAASVRANEIDSRVRCGRIPAKFLGRRFLDFSAGTPYIAPDINPLFMTSLFALFHHA